MMPEGNQAMSEKRLSDEPTLDQILSDPIVRLLMQRDGVSEDGLRRLLRRQPERG